MSNPVKEGTRWRVAEFRSVSVAATKIFPPAYKGGEPREFQVVIGDHDRARFYGEGEPREDDGGDRKPVLSLRTAMLGEWGEEESLWVAETIPLLWAKWRAERDKWPHGFVECVCAIPSGPPWKHAPSCPIYLAHEAKK